MANKKYCQGCGQPTEYSFEQPKFCANCGNNFNTISVASNSYISNTQNITNKVIPSKPSIKVKPRKPVAFENDESFEQDDIDIDLINSMASFEFDSDIPQRKKIKIGDIVSSDAKAEPIKSEKRKINKKAILEDFKREASSKSSFTIGGEE